MIELSKDGKFMLVGDSIVSIEDLVSVETDETVSDVTESIENSSGDSLSEIFRDIKQKIITNVSFTMDGGGGRKVVKVSSDQLSLPTPPDNKLADVWKVLRDRQ